MNVLHFCSYYVGSKVYFELFKAISNVYSQQAYIPVRSEEHLLSKQVPGVDFYFYLWLQYAAQQLHPPPYF